MARATSSRPLPVPPYGTAARIRTAVVGVLVALATATSLPLAGGAPATRPDAQVDVAQPESGWAVPPDLTVRARVAAIDPPEPVTIAWWRGGEGLGGEVFRGTMGENLAVGQWSADVAVQSFVGKGKFPGKFFLTVTVGRGGKRRGRAGGRRGLERRAIRVRVSVPSMGPRPRDRGTHRPPARAPSAVGPNGGSLALSSPPRRRARAGRRTIRSLRAACATGRSA